jgi:hypothetical protein
MSTSVEASLSLISFYVLHVYCTIDVMNVL